MLLNVDPLYLANLIICLVILILGWIGSNKTGDKTLLLIGVAFGLFGLSYLAVLLGLKDIIEGVLITVRATAYLLVILALYKVYKVGKKA